MVFGENPKVRSAQVCGHDLQSLTPEHVRRRFRESNPSTLPAGPREVPEEFCAQIAAPDNQRTPIFRHLLVSMTWSGLAGKTKACAGHFGKDELLLIRLVGRITIVLVLVLVLESGA